MARLQNQYIFNEILDRLSGLASNIKLRASFNLLDSNVLSEDFYLGLLNLVYGWNLHNANSDVQNVQGIDLIDLLYLLFQRTHPLIFLSQLSYQVLIINIGNRLS